MAVYTHEHDKARRSDGFRSKLVEMFGGTGSGG
jgi:hypothetical protein